MTSDSGVHVCELRVYAMCVSSVYCHPFTYNIYDAPVSSEFQGSLSGGDQLDSTWIQVKSVTSTAEYRVPRGPQRPGFSFEPGHSTSAERTQCYSKKGKWSEYLSFLLVLLPCTSQPLKIMTGGNEKIKTAPDSFPFSLSFLASEPKVEPVGSREAYQEVK